MPKLLYLDAKGTKDEREWDAVYEMEDGTVRRVRNPERAKFEQEHRSDRNWQVRLAELEKRVAVLEAKQRNGFALALFLKASLAATPGVVVAGRAVLAGGSACTAGRGARPPRERLEEGIQLPAKSGKQAEKRGSK